MFKRYVDYFRLIDSLWQSVLKASAPLDYNMEALQKKTTNLDSTLAELGTLGRYQVLHYFLLAVITLLSTSAYLSYIFTTGQLDYR